MTANDLEALFDRYRREGDLRALGEVFDRTAEELLRIARHLAKDEAAAEDLVQATYLAAIEHADRFDAARGLVAWLAGVMTNKAKLARALSARSPDPDRLIERQGEDPALDAEMREFVRALEVALERVPEAYRRVLRIHLAEGKGAEEIATVVRQPAGTVRVQLHRGLKLLRKYLPAGFALGGVAVLSGSRGLAAVRERVLGHAASVAKGATAGAASRPAAEALLTGGRIATSAAVLALVLGGLWWRARDRAPDTPAIRVARADRTIDSPGNGENAARESPLVSAEEQGRAAAEPDDPFGALDLEIAWSDGSPAAEVEAIVVPTSERQPFQHLVRARSDDRGRAHVDRIRAGQASIYLDRSLKYGAPVVASIERARTNSARVEVPEWVDVTGVVLDAGGQPIPGADIYATPDDPRGWGTRFGTSGSDGSFLVKSLHPRFAVFAVAAGRGTSDLVRIEEEGQPVPRNRTIELRIRGEALDLECRDLEGRVLDPEGQPVPGARVKIQATSVFKDNEILTWPGFVSTTAADGSYRASGLTSSSARIFVDALGHPLWKGSVRFPERGTARLDVNLESGLTITGSARDRSGAPVTEGSIRQVLDPDWDSFSQVWTALDPEGRFRLEGVSAGTVRLDAESGRKLGSMRSSTVLEGRPKDELRWDVVFGKGNSIRGRVVDDQGDPLAGWKITARPPEGNRVYPKSEQTDDRGGFELKECAEEPYVVFVYAPGEKHPRSHIDAVMPGGPEVVVRIDANTRPSAYIVGTVLGSDGSPASGLQVSANHLEREAYGGSKTDGDGRFRLGPFPPGSCALTVNRAQKLVLGFGPIQLEPDEEHDAGRLQLQDPGSLELILHREDGVPLPKESSIIVLDALGYASFAQRKDGDRFKISALIPGTYRLFCTIEGVATVMRSFEIRSRETTQLEWTVPPGTLREFEFDAPDDGPTPQRIRFVVRNAKEVLVDMISYRSPPAAGRGAYSVMAGFSPGHYTYDVAGAEGLHAQGEFDVVDLNPATAPIKVSLERTR